jgi:NADH-quinone oxidoreductase subunit M
MILLGAFSAHSSNGLIPEAYAIVATFGLLLGAAYFLWTIQRMFFGAYHVKANPGGSVLPDLNKRELSMMLPLAFLALFFGIFPQVLLDFINPFAENFVGHLLKSLP